MGRVSGFKQEVHNSLSAPVRLKRILQTQWKEVYPTKRYPFDKTDFQVFLALLYKLSMLEMQKGAKTITEKFAANHNRALAFQKFEDEHVFSSYQKIFQTEGDRQMAKITKKVTKKVSKDSKNSKVKDTESKPRTDSTRYMICNLVYEERFTDREIAEKLCVKKGITKDLYKKFSNGIVGDRKAINAGERERLGFPAKKNDIEPVKKENEKKSSSSGKALAKKGGKVSKDTKKKKKLKLA